MKKILQLFLTMLKIGLVTFGGGYAMIAILEHEFVEKKQWIDKEDFANMLSIAESTPGPIAINSATYIGYKIGKFWGSLAATVGVCIPSFVIIFLISLFFDRFVSLTYVAYAFRGIQVCVTFLILNAGVKMFKQMEKTPFNFIVLGLTGAAVITLSLLDIGFSSIYYILIAAGLGLTVYLAKFLRDKGKHKENSEITDEDCTETSKPVAEPNEPTRSEDCENVAEKEKKEGGLEDDLS